VIDLGRYEASEPTINTSEDDFVSRTSTMEFVYGDPSSTALCFEPIESKLDLFFNEVDVVGERMAFDNGFETPVVGNP